jgi:hypothetical protein
MAAAKPANPPPTIRTRCFAMRSNFPDGMFV